MSGLAGRTVVNTRATHQAAELDAQLQASGALSVPYPCIALTPPEDSAPLDAALRDLANGVYEGLVLTSTNTVLVLAWRLQALGLQLTANALRVAAVGPATAQAAEHLLGVAVQTVPDEHVAEALAEAMGAVAGMDVLLPQSALAANTLARTLASSGAYVTEVDAYTMGIGSGGVELLPMLHAGKIDAVTLSSGSTARNLLERLAREGGDLKALEGLCIACIGPKTADAARELGLSVAVVPNDYTLEALVAALDTYFEAHSD